MKTKRRKCVWFKKEIVYDAIQGCTCDVRCVCEPEREHCKVQRTTVRPSSFSQTARLATLCPHRVLVRRMPKDPKPPKVAPVKLCLFCTYFWSGRWPLRGGARPRYEIQCRIPPGWSVSQEELEAGGPLQLRLVMTRAASCPYYSVVGGDDGVAAKFLRGEGGYD